MACTLPKRGVFEKIHNWGRAGFLFLGHQLYMPRGQGHRRIDLRGVECGGWEWNGSLSTKGFFEYVTEAGGGVASVDPSAMAEASKQMHKPCGSAIKRSLFCFAASIYRCMAIYL